MAVCVYARKSWVQPFKNDWLIAVSTGLTLVLLNVNNHNLTVVVSVVCYCIREKKGKFPNIGIYDADFHTNFYIVCVD